MEELLIKVGVPVLTTLAGVFGTIYVAKLKSKRNESGKQPTDEIAVVHSKRIDSSAAVPENFEGAVCYKTRRFDRIRAPFNGTVVINANKLTITGQKHEISMHGVMPIASNGMSVSASEDIAIVTAIESGEGRLFVKVTERNNSSEQA